MFNNNKNLIYLFLGQLISFAGDSIYMIALPWLILDITNSSTTTALVTMSSYLPTLVFGIFAGAIVDKYSKKKIMIISDLLRFTIVLLFPLLILSGNKSTLLLGILAFSISLSGIPFYPARDSLIPIIVSKENLNSANSIITISAQLAHIIGPFIAGIMVTIVGIVHLFTFDAITFLVSIFFINLIIEKKDAKKISDLNNTKFLWGGVTYLKKNKGLLVLFYITVINNFFIMGPAIIGVPVFVKKILDNSFTTLGLMETFLAIGMMFGSFLVMKLTKKITIKYILITGIIIDGITFIPFYYLESAYFSIVAMLIHGIGIPMITISRTLLIQRTVPSDIQGRIFTLFHMAVIGTSAISISAVGIILDFISIKILFFTFGFCAMLCSIILIMSKKFLALK